MKPHDLVGKLAVKTAVRKFTGICGTDVDASFTYDPVFIEAYENGIVFYKCSPNSEPKILSPNHQDESWREIPVKFIPTSWREFMADKIAIVTV